MSIICFWKLSSLMSEPFHHLTDHSCLSDNDAILNCLNGFPFLFQLKEYSQKAVEILRAQNHILTNHPNSNIYKYVYTNVLSCSKENAISCSWHHLLKNVIIWCFLMQHAVRSSGVWWILSGEWPLLGVQQSRSSLLSMCNTPSQSVATKYTRSLANRIILQVFSDVSLHGFCIGYG